jgi:GntR family transcriptional regulator
MDLANDGIEITAPSRLTEAVAENVLRYIETADLGAAGRLPPERTLSQLFDVSRSTLRKALAHLAAQGHVTPAPQSGWFIRDVPYGPPPRQLLSFTEMARRRGLSVQTRVTRSVTRLASHEERQRLQPRRSDDVLELERIRLLEGEPICVERSVIALWQAPGLETEDLSDKSLYAVLESRGTVPSRSDFVISAALAGSIAPLLDIDPADPVLVGEELSFNQHGSPLMLSTANYRANAYRFLATLTASRPPRR